MNSGCERLTDRALFRGKVSRKREQLVWSNHHKTCEGAIHPVAHAPPLDAKHKLAVAAVNAMAAGNRSGSKNAISVSCSKACYILSRLNDRRCHFMAKDDRRKIAKRVMKNVQVGPTDPTPGNLEFYLVWAATRFFNLTDLDVSRTFGELYESFHFRCAHRQKSDIPRNFPLSQETRSATSNVTAIGTSWSPVPAAARLDFHPR